MKRPALFLGAFTAAMLALPALAADGAAEMMGFRWGKNAFNFEPRSHAMTDVSGSATVLQRIDQQGERRRGLPAARIVEMVT